MVYPANVYSEATYPEAVYQDPVYGDRGAVAPVPPVQAESILWLTASPARCFSDVAGTIPAVVGGEVKCWKDQSGSAIVFTQALGPTTFRRLQQTAGGKYYVEFGGGANDWLGSPANAAFNARVGGCVGLAVRPGVQVSTLYGAVSLGAGGSSDTFCLLRGDGTALHTTKWQSIIGGLTVLTSATDTVAYAQADVRIISRCEPVALDTHRLWKNGVQVVSSARATGMPAVNGALRIATDVFDAGRLYVGRVYGLVVYPRDLTEPEATALDTYLVSLV